MDAQFLRAEKSGELPSQERKPVECMGEYDGGSDSGVGDGVDHESDLGCQHQDDCHGEHHGGR